jgi:hypothetical protein
MDIPLENLQLFSFANGIYRLTGEKVGIYVLNIDTNEQFLLAEAGDIEVTLCYLDKKENLTWNATSVLFNLDIIVVMQRQYNVDNYASMNPYKFYITFSVAGENGNPQKIKLTNCLSAVEKLEFNLRLPDLKLDIQSWSWNGTAQDIVEVD